MTGSIRCLSALAAAGAFFVPATAFAATYEPSLRVTADETLGAKTGVGIILDQGACCYAAGRITIYSPPGYGVKLDHPAGTELGTLLGTIRVGGVEQMALAFIKAESPQSHVGNSCAPGMHDAVWMFDIQSAPYRFRVPMFVDRVAAGPEAAFAAVRMVICFASPHVPPPQGAPAGIAVGGVSIGVREVFTTPASAGTYAWNATFVPYAPGSASLSHELAAASSSYARLPVTLTLTVKRLTPRGKTFVATACIRENGEGIRGVHVSVVGRPTRRTTSFTQYGQGRTDSRGCFVRRFKPKHRVTFGEVWTRPLLRGAPACSGVPGARCSRPTMASTYFQRRFRIRR